MIDNTDLIQSLYLKIYCDFKIYPAYMKNGFWENLSSNNYTYVELIKDDTILEKQRKLVHKSASIEFTNLVIHKFQTEIFLHYNDENLESYLKVHFPSWFCEIETNLKYWKEV